MKTALVQASGDVRLFYADTEGIQPPLLLLHSLSDNGHVFDAVLDAGLRDRFRCIIPDLRGRGRSDRPETGYTLDDHCDDLIALLDHLRLERVAVAGHSFGGLLGLYFASRHPERVRSLALIDAAAELNPLTPLFLVALTDRLGRWYPNTELYLTSNRAAPFMTHWDERMKALFLAELEAQAAGLVRVRTQRRHIAQVALDVYRISKHDWRRMATAFEGPALVLVAAEPFLMAQPVLFESKAVELAVLFPQGIHQVIPGNHFTMLYKGAQTIAEALIRQLLPRPTARQLAVL